MKKTKHILKKLLPDYAVVPLLFCLCVNGLVYNGTGLLAASWKHYDFTMAFDRRVPLIPEFISIYIGCFLFWGINYILIMRQGKEHCIRFATADIMSRMVCAVFFLILPTTNVRPVLEGNGIWVKLLDLIYTIDLPYNLFPSIHCLVSWFCFIGIRGNKKIPKSYRIFSCIFALLVCVSTQVTKQHYIIDAVGGILIAEAAYFVSLHTNLYKGFEKVFDRITGFLFRTGRSVDIERG